MRRLVTSGREEPQGRRPMAFPSWDFSHGPVRLSDSCFPVEGTLGLLRMHFLLAWASYRANPSLTPSCITPHPRRPSSRFASSFSPPPHMGLDLPAGLAISIQLRSTALEGNEFKFTPVPPFRLASGTGIAGGKCVRLVAFISPAAISLECPFPGQLSRSFRGCFSYSVGLRLHLSLMSHRHPRGHCEGAR